MDTLKNDINVRLVFLIMVVISAIVVITLFYLGSFDKLLGSYKNVDTKLNAVSNNLTVTQLQLSQCRALSENLSAELTNYRTLQEKSREEYSKIYEQTETELTSTQSGLASAKTELDSTKKSLLDTTAQLTTSNAQLDIKTKAYNELSSKYQILSNQKDRVDAVVDKLKECLQSHNSELACYQGIDTG